MMSQKMILLRLSELGERDEVVKLEEEDKVVELEEERLGGQVGRGRRVGRERRGARVGRERFLRSCLSLFSLVLLCFTLTIDIYRNGKRCSNSSGKHSWTVVPPPNK